MTGDYTFTKETGLAGVLTRFPSGRFAIERPAGPVPLSMLGQGDPRATAHSLVGQAVIATGLLHEDDEHRPIRLITTHIETVREALAREATEARAAAGVFCCDNCGAAYDPTASRWMCPVCHFKASCCEGAPA